MPTSLFSSLLRQVLSRKHYAWLLLGLAVGAFLLERTGLFLAPEASPTSEASEEFLVTRVVDGDTFELANGEKVRLIGIDTPESVKPNSPIECFGQEASTFLKDKIEGKTLRLERDVSDRDRYGRLLRYAYLGDEFINETLVRAGYATAASFPPDIAEQELFRAAEEEARLKERGLFALDVCAE